MAETTTKRRKTPNLMRRGRKWVVHFRAKDAVTGKRRQEWKTFDTRDEALRYLTTEKAKIARKEWTRPTDVLFRDVAVEWMRTYAQGNVRPGTLATYDNLLRCHLLPEFGQRHLSEITKRSVQAFVADWRAAGPGFQARLARARELEAERARAEGRPPRPVRRGNSPKTISNGLGVLREMLAYAVEWSYLTVNPAAQIRRPKPERTEMRFLDADEVRRLLAAAEPEWRTLILTLVTTGMRIGELLALRWGDVDWHKRRVWVRRSVDRAGRFSEPKTRTSVRAIAAPPSLIASLREHLLRSRFSGEDDLVFPTTRGTPADYGNVTQRALKPALRRARLPQVRLHDLRHTYASLLIAQGDHPKLISEQLGHASVQITLDRYGHLMDQSYGDASDRLEQALFGKGEHTAAQISRIDRSER
jgi:integrase